LRSLQSLNFQQMRLFIRERRALARVAPHLVRPLPFVVPTYRHAARSRLALRAALTINELMSRDRHDGLEDPALQLPPGRVVSRDECLRLNPVIEPRGVTGGAVWYDYQMHNTDRMTLSFVLSAAEAGAVAVNYAEATTLLDDGTRVSGVTVRDAITSDTFDLRGDAVLNATGPWAAHFLRDLRERTTPAPLLSRAMNVVTRRIPVPQACGGRAGGRYLFLMPWRDVTLVGTSHDVHANGPDALSVTRRDLEAFLTDVREAFPLANLSAADVRLVHRGLLPMVSGRDHDVKLLRESVVVDHTRDGTAGLISIFGVRYTTARHTAARAVDAVFRQRGIREPPPCRTDTTPVFGSANGRLETLLPSAGSRGTAAIPAEMLRRLAVTYGTLCNTVLQLLHEDPALAEPLGQNCPVSGAEIVYAVRHESAIRLADALIRRTEAGSAGHPGRDAIDRAAAVMCRELDWDERTARHEIAEVEAFYQLP